MTTRRIFLSLGFVAYAIAIPTVHGAGPAQKPPEVKLYLLTALIQEKVGPDGQVHKEVVVERIPKNETAPLLPDRFYQRWSAEWGWNISFTDRDGRLFAHPSRNGGLPGGDLERVSVIPGDYLGNRHELHVQFDYQWDTDADGRRYRRVKWSITKDEKVKMYFDYGFGQSEIIPVYDPRQSTTLYPSSR